MPGLRFGLPRAWVTVQDSNEFHALALDTDSPIFCVNDASRALVALVVVLAVGLGVCALEVWTLPRRRRRCLVNLRDAEGTIEGVLWTRRGAWLILKDARFLRQTGEAVAVDGDVLVDRAQVAFIQVF